MKEDNTMNHFRAITVVEDGEGATKKEAIAAWQFLIDTGACWQLQGWFGRTAAYLIDEGLCTSPNVQDMEIKKPAIETTGEDGPCSACDCDPCDCGWGNY